MNISTLTVEIDSSGAKKGADQFVAAGKKVEGGAAAMAAAIENSAGRVETALEKEARQASRFAAEYARLDAENAARAARIAASRGGMSASMEALHGEALKMNADVDAAFAKSSARLDMYARDAAKAGEMIRGVMDSLLFKLGALIGISAFSKLAAEAQQLEVKLRAVTGDADAFAAVQMRLKGIASATNSEYQSSVDLYTRIIRSAKNLGASQSEALKVTEAVANALKAGGANASESASAVMQLGQALQSGKLVGDELRAILENAPILAQAIADNIGDGTQNLRQLAKEGKLASKDVFQAILKSAEMLNAEGAKMSGTVGQSFIDLKNQALYAADAFSKATHFTELMSMGIGLLATNIEYAYVAFGVLFTVMAVGKIVQVAFAFESLSLAIKGIGIAISSSTPLMVAITAAIGAVLYVMGRFAGKQKDAREAQERLNASLKDMDPQYIKTYYTAVTSKLEQVIAAQDRARNSLGGMSDVKKLQAFRAELETLQGVLRGYVLLNEKQATADAIAKDADAAAKAKEARESARRQVAQLLEAEQGLAKEKMLASGQYLAIAALELDARSAGVIVAIKAQAVEGEITKARAGRLIAIEMERAALEKVRVEQERVQAITEEFYDKTAELTIRQAELDGDSLSVWALRKEQERKAAVDAITARKDLNAIEMIGMVLLDSALRYLDAKIEKQKILKAQAIEMGDLQNTAFANEVRAMGMAKAADALGEQYARNAYLRSLAEREGLSKLSDQEIEARMALYDRNQEALRGLKLLETSQAKTKQVYENLSRGLQTAFAQTFVDIFEKGIKSFGDLFDRIKDLFLKMLAEMAAAALVKKILAPLAESLGLAVGGGMTLSQVGNADYQPGKKFNGAAGRVGGSIIGGAVGAYAGYTSGDAIGGALSGAAAGFAMGGPVGAVVGGVAGIVGGLIGAGKKAREAEEAFRETNTKFALAFDEYLKNLRGFYEGFRGQVKQLEDDVKAQGSEAIALFGQSGLGGRIKDFEEFRKIYEDEGVAGIQRFRDELAKMDARSRPFDLKDLDILIERLTTLGEAAFEAADKIRQGFIDGLKAEANDLAGNGALNVFKAIEDERAQRLKDDAYFGSGLADLINSNADLKIQDFIKGLSFDDLTKILPLVSGQIHDWVAATIATGQAAKDAADAAVAEQLAKDKVLTMEQKGLELLRRRAELSGDPEMLRLVSAAEITAAYKQERRGLEDLLAAGLITQEFFTEFATFLTDEMGAAIKDVMDGTAEALRILQNNLTALNQEAEVFGYSAQEVSKRVDELYGFTGKSDDDLRAMFTKYAPGADLTESQARLNDAITEALRVRGAAAVDVTTVGEDVGSRVAAGTQSPNGTVYTGPVTVQISLNVNPDTLRDAERTAAQIADRLDRLLAGKASLAKSAAGSL